MRRDTAGGVLVAQKAVRAEQPPRRARKAAGPGHAKAKVPAPVPAERPKQPARKKAGPEKAAEYRARRAPAAAPPLPAPPEGDWAAQQTAGAVLEVRMTFKFSVGQESLAKALQDIAEMKGGLGAEWSITDLVAWIRLPEGVRVIRP